MLRASGWIGEQTCERCSALTSSGSDSSRARSPVGLCSTWPGCLVELPPRSAVPWTGSASQRLPLIGRFGRPRKPNDDRTHRSRCPQDDPGPGSRDHQVRSWRGAGSVRWCGRRVAGVRRRTKDRGQRSIKRTDVAGSPIALRRGACRAAPSVACAQPLSTWPSRWTQQRHVPPDRCGLSRHEG